MVAPRCWAWSAALCLGLAGFAAAQTAGDKPLTEQDLTALVQLQIDDAAITAKIQKSGLGFAADDAALARLKKAGATDAVVKAVQAAAAAPKAAAPQQAITYQNVLQLLT